MADSGVVGAGVPVVFGVHGLDGKRRWSTANSLDASVSFGVAPGGDYGRAETADVGELQETPASNRRHLVLCVRGKRSGRPCRARGSDWMEKGRVGGDQNLEFKLQWQWGRRIFDEKIWQPGGTKIRVWGVEK